MANKQHIYKGAGEPWEVLADFDDSECHHYINTETGDVYIGGGYGRWIKVSDPADISLSAGLEVNSAPIGASQAIPTPSGPMLWIDESNGDAYLATATGFPSTTWEWRKISFV